MLCIVNSFPILVQDRINQHAVRVAAENTTAIRGYIAVDSAAMQKQKRVGPAENPTAVVGPVIGDDRVGDNNRRFSEEQAATGFCIITGDLWSCNSRWTVMRLDTTTTFGLIVNNQTVTNNSKGVLTENPGSGLSYIFH